MSSGRFCWKIRDLIPTTVFPNYYEADGEVIELLETGVPYAPHVKAKITWKRKIEICVSKLYLERGKSCVRSFQTGFRITPTVTKMV